MAHIDVIDSKTANAQEQMTLDQKLIEALPYLERPLVRLYRFEKKSITYGYFQKIETLIDCEKAQKYGYDIARRPTGGGTLFHTRDFSFTVALPAHHVSFSNEVLPNYHLINETLLNVLVSLDASFHTTLSNSETNRRGVSPFCMASPSKYDLLWQGKKIGGASQRKTKFGFVHQSSLFLEQPDFSEIRAFSRHNLEAIEDMKRTSCALMEKSNSKYTTDTFCHALTCRFLEFFSKRLQSRV